MKNILFTAAASIGLSASAHAQEPKTLFQYQQKIQERLVSAIANNTIEKNALPMPEWDTCYAFEAKINGIDRQVFYCTDTKKTIFEWWEDDKNVDIQERQWLLDAITKRYP